MFAFYICTPMGPFYWPINMHPSAYFTPLSLIGLFSCLGTFVTEYSLPALRQFGKEFL